MTVSFLTMLGTPPADSPVSTVDNSSVCRTAPQLRKLSDGEREAAIALAASLICHHIELWEISGDFADRGNADRARLSMEALIAGRKVNAE